MSKRIGPYQHCPKCNTEKSHMWVEELVYACTCCGKETKVVQTAKKRLEVMTKPAEGFKRTPTQEEKDFGVTSIGPEGYYYKGDEPKSFVEKQVPAMIEHNIKQYLEDKPKPAATGWGAKLR